MNLCIVNEDHPRCNVPRKAIKACPGRGWALWGPLWPSCPLSHLESGHAVPFSLQDFCSPCVFVYCCHNTGSCWPGSASTQKPCLLSRLMVQVHPRIACPNDPKPRDLCYNRTQILGTCSSLPTMFFLAAVQWVWSTSLGALSA